MMQVDMLTGLTLVTKQLAEELSESGDALVETTQQLRDKHIECNEKEIRILELEGQLAEQEVLIQKYQQGIELLARKNQQLESQNKGLMGIIQQFSTLKEGQHD